MKKVLLVSRLGTFFTMFELSNIKILQELGCEVWCAANFEQDNHKLDSLGVHKVHVELFRSPVDVRNLVGYRQLVRLMREHRFRLVHCHMPVGGVFARLAAHRTSTAPLLYTAHGFHFCQGVPWTDWLLFYPVEKFLSAYTDVLITINHEDYQLAAKKFHMGRLICLNGVGIDYGKFSSGNDIRRQLRQRAKISSNGYLLLSIGELNKNKNHEVVIRGIAQLKERYRKENREWNIRYFICGIGRLDRQLRKLCRELRVEDSVYFLGWRDDIADLCASVDAFIFPSKREGLPVALMEAMAAGLPVVASGARGNTELVENHVNGILCYKNTPQEYAQAIERIRSMDRETVKCNSKRILEPYRKELAQEKMKRIYQKYLRNQTQEPQPFNVKGISGKR